MKKEVRLTILVTELVRGPHAALAIRTVDRVNESVSLGLLRARALVGRVAQQSWRHARPTREDDEGEEVAHGHRASSLFIQGRVERRPAVRCRLARQRALCVTPRPCRREVVEDDEEENTSWNVDERVRTVGPVHQRCVLQEPLLDGSLDEDVQPLFQVDELKGVSTGDVDGRLVHCQGTDGPTNLIHL